MSASRNQHIWRISSAIAAVVGTLTFILLLVVAQGLRRSDPGSCPATGLGDYVAIRTTLFPPRVWCFYQQGSSVSIDLATESAVALGIIVAALVVFVVGLRRSGLSAGRA